MDFSNFRLQRITMITPVTYIIPKFKKNTGIWPTMGMKNYKINVPV